MKKTDLFLQYRSVLKPRPLWTETALYGGYEYIEVSEGLWIRRQYEYLLNYALTGESQTLREEACRELKSESLYFKPSALQQSDYAKLCVLLNKQKEVCIEGYSYSFDLFSQKFPFIKFYTNANYTQPNFIQLPTEELCKLSSTIVTLVNPKSSNLKLSLRNWANVIPYSANFFDEDLLDNNFLEGGAEFG